MTETRLPLVVRERLTRLLLFGRGRLSEFRGWSSEQLARLLGTSPETVRKDLAWAQRKRQGGVWSSEELVQGLESLLGLTLPVRAALVGLDDWVVDLVLKRRRTLFDLDLVMAFDSRTNRLETLDTDLPLFPSVEMTQRVSEAGIKAALLATDPVQAPRQLERLTQGGVIAVLNWTGAFLRPRRGTVLVNGGFQQEWSFLAGRLVEELPGG